MDRYFFTDTSKKTYLWLTDIHFDGTHPINQKKYLEKLQKIKCDAVLITGDISNQRNVEYTLEAFFEYTQVPIYFVLGSHDFYF